MSTDYAAMDRIDKGSTMLSWLRRRRERAKRIDAEAEALIRAFGVDAYSEARQRERQADSEAAAQEWSRVALAIALKTDKRVGLDTATRMAASGGLARPRVVCPSVPDPLDELRRLISKR